MYDPLSNTNESDLNSNPDPDSRLEEKLDRLETVVKAQEQRIRVLESSKPQEEVSVGLVAGGGGEGDLTERERKVMEYIVANPNVTKQDVVDHFKGKIARVPVFNTIDSLVRCGIIDDNPDLKNRQVHRLSLNNTSVFYSVLQELTQFEKSFRTLTQKIKQKGEELKNSPSTIGSFEHATLDARAVLDRMIESYILRYTEVWPKKFRDRKDVLNKLLVIVLNRISSLREYLPTTPPKNIEFLEATFMTVKLRGSEHLKYFVTASEEYGLTKEMEPVLDSIWKIDKEIQEYAYPEARFFSWKEFVYGKDDWRKLLELTKKHPDQTFSSIKEKMPVAIEMILKHR